MNALAVGVDQPRAFAAQRLRQQEPRRAGDARARSDGTARTRDRRRARRRERHRDAVAGRDRRVRRLAKDLAGAAGRQQRRAGPDVRGAPSGIEVVGRRRRARRRSADRRSPARARRRGCADARDARCPQHAADLAAGGVAGVQHAADAVRRLAAERRLAVRARDRTPRPSRSARWTSARAVLDQRRGRPRASHRPSPAASVSVSVQLPGVVVADRGGDAALRVAGVALGRRRLGQHQDLARLGERDRGAQPGDAAADDEKIRRRGQRCAEHGRGCWIARRRSRRRRPGDGVPGSYGILAARGGVASRVLTECLWAPSPSPSAPARRRTSYPIRIGRGLGSSLGRSLAGLAGADRAIVVSSPRVWAAVGARVQAGLPDVPVVAGRGRRAGQAPAHGGAASTTRCSTPRPIARRSS